MESLDMDITGGQETERAGMSRRKRTMNIIAVVVIVMAVLSCTAAWAINNHSSGNAPDQGAPAVTVQVPALEAAAAVGLAATEPGTETEKAEYAAPHKTEAVKLSDIYAVSGSMVQLECYYPDAESYTWEVYDRHMCTWETAEGETLQDELYRPVSVLRVEARGADTAPVRCLVRMDSGETVTESASVYMIPDIRDISADDYTTDAGKYISAREIPVRVTYADGTKDTITGLYGAVFVESTESRETSASGTGNPVETVTTVYTECSYAYIGLEDKEICLRYRCGEQVLDTDVTVSGKDLCAPVISDVAVSGFEITNVDTAVTASITITAEDDKTPYPDLEYAFIPKDTEGDTIPDEKDWVRNASFDLDITQNGTWTAFCRDRGGNTASVEKEIIVVDQKAPVISVRLLSTEWCSSNQIIADAEDYLPVEYRFLSQDGEDSGWTARNKHDVACNGTWEVQARDSAGNVSAESITVSNIDRQSPVISMITVEKAPEENGTEGETEGGRDED